MNIKVLYFGMIAEMKGLPEEVKVVNENEGLQSIIDLILLEIPLLKDINYVVALNQVITEISGSLKDGDEISLFPPFAGG